MTASTTKPSVIFMGTPEFAVASLGALIMNGYDILSVVTAPDKPSGRGRKLGISAVKEFALHYEIPVLQPVNLKDQAFIDELISLNADIFVVVAFRMLPEQVWKIPRLGTINLHASLLPQYRGAAPINHALINGEKITGVTTFLIDNKIDTGGILLKEELPVGHLENFGELHDRLMKQGASLVIMTIQGLTKGTLKPLPQDTLPASEGELKRAGKIYPSICIIDWEKSANEVHNLIRGLSPYPGARTTFRSGEREYNVKILEAQPAERELNMPAGTILMEKDSFLIFCRDEALKILKLQAESKKAMSSGQFLRGNDLTGFVAAKDQV